MGAQWGSASAMYTDFKEPNDSGQKCCTQFSLNSVGISHFFCACKTRLANHVVLYLIILTIFGEAN
jgi:hypothetical protein